MTAIIPIVFANPSAANVSSLQQVLRRLLSLAKSLRLRGGAKADLLAALELAIVALEATPFSPIGVGTALQQLLDALLSIVLQESLDPALKDSLINAIRIAGTMVSNVLGETYLSGEPGAQGPPGPPGFQGLQDLQDRWDPAVRLDQQVDQGHKGLPDLSERPDLWALTGLRDLWAPLGPLGLSGPLDRKALPDLSALRVLRGPMVYRAQLALSDPLGPRVLRALQGLPEPPAREPSSRLLPEGLLH